MPLRKSRTGLRHSRRETKPVSSFRGGESHSERSQPKTTCCGVPVIWVRSTSWEDEAWEGECIWCGREFCYVDARVPVPRS